MAEVERFSDSSSSSDVEAIFEAEEVDPGGENVLGITPYRYEPYLDDSEYNSDDESGSNVESAPQSPAPGPDGEIPADIGRLQNTEWSV